MTSELDPLTSPPKLLLVHRIEGRLRLRFDGKVPEGHALEDLANSLASVEGIHRVRARPNTGSVILDLDLPAATVLDALTKSGLVIVAQVGKPPPVGQIIQLGLAQADAKLAQQTEGAVDLRTAIGLALLAGAILQLTRGRIAGPAATLGMAAFSLLDRSRS